MTISLQPMTLMIIEDEKSERDKFLVYAKSCPEKIRFVASTNSSRRGIEVMREVAPEGIILDLELKDGIGSGMEFLSTLKIAGSDGLPIINYKPIIIVTTNNPSEHTHNAVRGLGVDLIFYKKQIDYSPRLVIDHLLMFRSVMGAGHNGFESKGEPVEVDDLLDDSEDAAETISPDEAKKQTNIELDAIGMGRHYRGRNYLVTAISSLVVCDNDAPEDRIIFKVAQEHEVQYSSVLRAMQTAIENTWYDCEPEVLSRQYATHVSQVKGRPTPNELIHYYADKVRDNIIAERGFYEGR